MKKVVFFLNLTAIAIFFVLFFSTGTHADCTKDIDCKGDRVCEKGICVDPRQTNNAAKASSPEAMAAKKQKEDKEWLKKLNGARFAHFFSYRFGTFDITLDIKGNEVIVGQIWKWLEPQFASTNPHVLVGVWIPYPHNFGPFTITGRKFNIPKTSWCNGGLNCDEMATIRDDGETIFYSFTQSDGQRIEMVYRRQR
jgi:hypothetical protein